jgi:hypothetical protein
MEIFSIGEYVYIADMHAVDTTEPCPVCYGKKMVIVILGNGDQVETECGYCGHGFEGPLGYVKTGDRLVEGAHMSKITGVDVRTADDGSMDITYWFNGCGYHQNRVAKTYEEAVELGKITAAKYQHEDHAHMIDMAKHNINKSYAWNVGYHLKSAERAKKDLEYHEAKAKLLQTKVKEEKKTAGHP